jgi:hypothetical protein
MATETVIDEEEKDGERSCQVQERER